MDIKLMSNVESAQSISGVPSSEIMIPYPSIRSLLDSQVQRYGNRTFLNINENNKWSQISFIDFFHQVCKCANFLRKEKVSFGDRVNMNYNGKFRSLIQIFGIWEVGATVNLNNDEIESDFFTDPSLFDKTIAQESNKVQIGKKSKLSDGCLILDNNFGKNVLLSHYNLMVSGMAISSYFRLSDKDIIGCSEKTNDLLNLSSTIMSGLYSGCQINLGTGLSTKVFFSYDNHLVKNSEFLLKPHNSYQENIGVPGFFIPELSGFASFNLKDNNLSNGFIPIGQPLNICEMSIIDDEGNQVKNGNYGFLGVRGHNVMKGYLDKEEDNSNSFKKGWLNTGWEAIAEQNPSNVLSYFVSNDKPS
tara:strand:- start:298 stop:1377 length:1080 start_codon:yes stop_codon:yes gene_type:complete